MLLPCSVSYDSVETCLSESEAKVEKPTNHRPKSSIVIDGMLLTFNKVNQSSRRANQSRPGIERCEWLLLSILLPTPTIQVLRHNKQQIRKSNKYSASDSVGLICDFHYDHEYDSKLTLLMPKCNATSALLACGYNVHTALFKEVLILYFVVHSPARAFPCVATPHTK